FMALHRSLPRERRFVTGFFPLPADWLVLRNFAKPSGDPAEKGMGLSRQPAWACRSGARTMGASVRSGRFLPALCPMSERCRDAGRNPSLRKPLRHGRGGSFVGSGSAEFGGGGEETFAG